MAGSDCLGKQVCGTCNGRRVLLSGSTPGASWCFVKGLRVGVGDPGCGVWLPDSPGSVHVAAPLGAHVVEV